MLVKEISRSPFLREAITFQHKFTRKAMRSKLLSFKLAMKLQLSLLSFFLRFAVSFVPVEACDHVINVSFNKMPVKGCPIHVSISGHLSGPQVSGLSGPRAIGVPNSLIINHANGRLDESKFAES